MSRDPLIKAYHIAPAKLQHGTLLAGVLAAIGLAVMFLADASIPNAALIGAVNLLLAGGVFISVVRAARDPRPRMVLDRDGIWYRDWPVGRVPWRHLRGVHMQGSRVQTFACVELRDPESFLAALSEAERRKCRSNRLVRMPCLLVPHGALDAPLAQIVETIRAAIRSGQG
jgi:hypothetical protein